MRSARSTSGGPCRGVAACLPGSLHAEWPSVSSPSAHISAPGAAMSSSAFPFSAGMSTSSARARRRRRTRPRRIWGPRLAVGDRRRLGLRPRLAAAPDDAEQPRLHPRAGRPERPEAPRAGRSRPRPAQRQHVHAAGHAPGVVGSAAHRAVASVPLPASRLVADVAGAGPRPLALRRGAARGLRQGALQRQLTVPPPSSRGRLVVARVAGLKPSSLFERVRGIVYKGRLRNMTTDQGVVYRLTPAVVGYGLVLRSARGSTTTRPSTRCRRSACSSSAGAVDPSDRTARVRVDFYEMDVRPLT